MHIILQLINKKLDLLKYLIHKPLWIEFLKIIITLSHTQEEYRFAGYIGN